MSSADTDQVLEYNGTTGAFVTAFVGAGSGGLNPSDLVFGPNGNLFVSRARHQTRCWSTTARLGRS